MRERGTNRRSGGKRRRVSPFRHLAPKRASRFHGTFREFGSLPAGDIAKKDAGFTTADGRPFFSPQPAGRPAGEQKCAEMRIFLVFLAVVVSGAWIVACTNRVNEPSKSR